MDVINVRRVLANKCCPKWSLDTGSPLSKNEEDLILKLLRFGKRSMKFKQTKVRAKTFKLKIIIFVHLFAI